MKKRNALLIIVALLFGACASHQSKSDFFEQIKSETLTQKMSDAEAKGHSTVLITMYDERGKLDGYQLSVYAGEKKLEEGSFDESQTMVNWSKMNYDADGNLLSEYVLAEGIKENEALRRAIRRCTYDENGNRLCYWQYKVSEDGTGRLSLKVESVYDEEGNKISDTGYETVDGKEELRYSSEYLYDVADVVIEKITYYSDGKASNLHVCHYNEKNQKVFEKSGRILNPGEISEYNEATGWIYDENGNLLREERYVNADVVSYITYVYEKEEGLESCNWYEGRPKGEEVFKGGYVCEYNEQGLLCKRTEYDENKNQTSVTYEYDELGRVVKECAYKRGSCIRRYEYEYR